MVPVILSVVLLAIGLLHFRMQWGHFRRWRTHHGPTETASDRNLTVSVIVAARNEAEHLPALLDALVAGQRRVPDEICIVDDHSSDRSQELVLGRGNPVVRWLTAEGMGKRAALRTGCAAARGDILLFTDADCRPAPGWVDALCRTLETSSARFVAGPVIVQDEARAVTRYDALESQGMMVVIASAFLQGRPVLAQGASMGIRRQDLMEVGGFDHLPDRASGDDVFIMERVRDRWPDGCRFVRRRDAVVWTGAPSSWLALLRQRLRWTSKAAAIRSMPARWAMIRVFSASLVVLVYILGLPWLPGYLHWAGGAAVLLKISGDLLVLREGWRFSGQSESRRILPVALVMHPLLVVITGLAGPLRKDYRWKGRRVR